MAVAAKNPKGVRVRNDNLYVDFTHKHVRYRESLNLPPLPKNIKFAEQLLYDIHRAIKLGKYDRNDFFAPKEDAPKTTLKSYFDHWITVAKVEDRTRITYASDLKAIIGLLGGKELRDISHKDLQRWVDNSKLAAGTIHNRIGTLSSLYNHAILNDACIVNPVVKVTLPKRPPAGENIKAFSRTEMQTILNQLYSAGEHELHRLVWFMCETGLRISEAFCLRYGELHLHEGEEYINVTRSLNVRKKGNAAYRFKKPKNSRTRRVSLMDASIAAVKGSDPVPIDKRDPTAYIFINPRSGLLWDSSHLNDGTWRVMLKRCGVPYRPLKCLRHTFASLLVSSDYNLLYVSLELGHSSVKVTQDHYAKYLPDAVNEQRQRRNSQKTWGEFK